MRELSNQDIRSVSGAGVDYERVAYGVMGALYYGYLCRKQHHLLVSLAGVYGGLRGYKHGKDDVNKLMSDVGDLVDIMGRAPKELEL